MWHAVKRACRGVPAETQGRGKILTVLSRDGNGPEWRGNLLIPGPPPEAGGEKEKTTLMENHSLAYVEGVECDEWMVG